VENLDGWVNGGFKKAFSGDMLYSSTGASKGGDFGMGFGHVIFLLSLFMLTAFLLAD
jgi:hypothetical protein